MRKLQITIVHHRTPELLERCLDSLTKYNPEYREDILVIDNNSRDHGLKTAKEKFPGIKTLASPWNAGFARAVNWGINNSDHEYVLTLNPDVSEQVEPESVRKMVTKMDQEEDIAVLGPQLLGPDGSIQESCYRFQTPLFVTYRRTFLGRLPWARKTMDHILMRDWDHKTPRDVEWIQGSAMMVRRKAVKEVGLMDERFWMYIEDMDWCRRFWQKGWRVHYYPEARMAHHYLRQSKGSLISNKLARAHVISGVKYFAKYWGLARKRPPRFLIGQQNGEKIN